MLRFCAKALSETVHLVRSVFESLLTKNSTRERFVITRARLRSVFSRTEGFSHRVHRKRRCNWAISSASSMSREEIGGASKTGKAKKTLGSASSARPLSIQLLYRRTITQGTARHCTYASSTPRPSVQSKYVSVLPSLHMRAALVLQTCVSFIWPTSPRLDAHMIGGR